jgi:hypothetical protein
MKDTELLILLGGGVAVLYFFGKPLLDIINGIKEIPGKIAGGAADMIIEPGNIADLIGHPIITTPEQAKKTGKALAQTMPKITPTGIAKNPVGSFWDMFKILPDITKSVITGVITPPPPVLPKQQSYATSNKAFEQIHPPPPIVTATKKASAMLTSGANAVQSMQYSMGKKIVAGKKVF